MADCRSTVFTLERLVPTLKLSPGSKWSNLQSRPMLGGDPHASSTEGLNEALRHA